MSDFYSGEVHQGVSEFFPQKAKTGKRSIKTPAAKILAAIAGAAVTATLLFSAFVDCFASEILPDSVKLNISVKNIDPRQTVEWQLIPDGEEDSIKQGVLEGDKVILPLDELEPDTKYKIIFTIPTDDGDEEIGDYEFTTPGEKTPAVSPPPQGGTDNPPGPAVSPPPAVSPSPSSSAEPSPSPSISPSPSPSVAPSVAPTTEPTVSPQPSEEPSPSPSPEVPVPSAGTPSLSDIAGGADGSHATMTFNFPFSMNSTADYTNEFVDVEITYSSEDYGNPVEENAVVTVTASPDENGNVTVGWPLYAPQFGSTTAKATLRYNRVNVATGEVETDLTLDSDDLNVQALFAGVETEDSTGLAITNLVGDPETNRLTGTVAIDVGKGTYTAKNSVSQLSVYRIWFDIYDAEGNLVNTTRDISFDYGNLVADNSTATLTTDFDIDLADLGLVPGEIYRVEARANADWLLDNVSAGTSIALGMEEFQYGQAPEYVEPEAGTSEISNYIAPTDNTSNGWVGQYSFIPNDAEIVSITIDETITEYDDINGATAGTTTSSATYGTGQIYTSEDGSQIYAEHTGHTTMSAYDYMYRYQATPVLTYTMPGDATQKQLTGETLDIDPYFYITYRDTAQSANSMTINSATLIEDGDVEMVEVNFSAQIRDIHVGNTGAFVPISVTLNYYSDNLGNDWVEVPEDSYTAGDDGSVTVTNAVVTVPAERFNIYNELSLTLEVESIWTVEIDGWNMEVGRGSTSVTALAAYTPPEQQGYMLTLESDIGLTNNTPTEVDMILQSVSMTYNNTTGLNEIPIAGGERVQIIYQFVGQVDDDILAIIAQITPRISDIDGNAISDTVIPGAGNMYTDEQPLVLVLEYQVPDTVTSDITLTPYCELFYQA